MFCGFGIGPINDGVCIGTAEPWQVLNLGGKRLGHGLSEADMLRATLPPSVDPEILLGALGDEFLEAACVPRG